MADSGPAPPDPQQQAQAHADGSSATGHPAPRLRVLLLTSAAILLLLGSTAAFIWHERAQVLAQAADLAVRRSAQLADELTQTLTLARVAIDHCDALLAHQADGLAEAAAQRAASQQRNALLAALPLPFRLLSLDAQGRVINGGCGQPPDGGSTAASDLQRPPSDVVPGRWWVGRTQGPPGERFLPLVWRSQAAPDSLGAYSVELVHSALQRRFEADRLPSGGGVALFRTEPDGTATLLARAPLVASEIGLTVRGPLVQALKVSPSGMFDAVTQIDGVRRIVAYQRLDGQAETLVVVYGMASAEVLAAWQTRLPWILGVSLLLSLGMGFGGWRLDRSLRAMAAGHAALSHSEQHFRALADNLPDVVTRIDRQGRLRYANAAMEQAMGVSPTAVLGQTTAALGLNSRDQAACSACLARLFSSGQPERLAFRRPTEGEPSSWESLLVLERNDGSSEPMALMISRNISEQRATEDALRGSEARLAYLLRSSPTVVYTALAKGDFGATYYSANLHQMLGWQPAQFIADSSFWLTHVHPDDREAVLAQMASLPELGELVLEYRFAHADGRWRWMRDAVRLMRDADGGPDELVGSWIDITDRVEAEQQRQATLRDSEALMRHFFDSGLVGMAITTAGQAGGQFNARLREMLGYDDAQMQRLSWPEITHPDDLTADQAEFSRLLAGEIEGYRMDKRVIRSDGSLLDAAIAVHCQRDSHGQPLRFFAIIEDIGARKQVEARLERMVLSRTAELTRSESRFRTIFETVPVAIGEEDWTEVQALLRGLRDDGVQDGPAYFAAHPDFVEQCLRAVRVLRMNQKALRLHDASDQTRELPNLQAMYPGRGDLPQFVGELEALWASQRQYTGDKSLPSLTGRPLRLMVTMSLPALDDADGTALACLVDISEIDRLNSELDRSVTRLRQVNQELETFTYSVSHDLKAPLRGIDGYSRLLLSDHQHQLDDEGRGFLQRIRQATLQMGVLIDDLLSYSRLERQALTLMPLPLAAIVDHVLKACQHDLQARGMQVQVSVPAGVRALGDIQGLTMSLRNLIDNALKFSRDSAEPRIEVSTSLASDRVQLAVRDHGLGFDMRFHDRIFGIFQRLHRAEEFPGTGVGLAIVRRAIERMGGRVWADSRPGHGATFTIELPLAPAGAAATGNAACTQETSA